LPSRPSGCSSSSSSSHRSSSQADDDGDDDGASGSDDGNSSAENVEDSDEDAHPKACATTNAMRKLVPSSRGKAGGCQQGGLEASSKRPSGASNAPAATASPDDLVLGEQQQYRLGATLYRSLYTHQVEGVRWLWSLFASGKGGILGDDMGLGKTMQCAAFLAGLLNSRLGKRAMVVAPKTLLMHWHKELKACGLGRHVHAFYGDSASERAASLCTATGKAGGVLLTTYGMCLHNADALARPARPTSSLFRREGAEEEEGAFRWDMVILDEGHKVKNPKMKLVQQLLKIPSHIRVIISGTPIQNNLAELRNLMDFCCEGLLGCSRTFSRCGWI
ncbi:P-loop containing nucleoside triphosphate hydrolase protein, partial [Dunaliella salina]